MVQSFSLRCILTRMRLWSYRSAEPASPKAGTPDAPPSGEAEQHPTERDLQGLREWVLTQQWLQQHAVAGAGALGAAAALPGELRAAAAGSAAAVAMQAGAAAAGQAPQGRQQQPLWDLEQRALQVLQQAQQQAQQAQQQDPAQPR